MNQVNYSSLKDFYETFKYDLSPSDYQDTDEELENPGILVENSQEHPELKNLVKFNFILQFYSIKIN